MLTAAHLRVLVFSFAAFSSLLSTSVFAAAPAMQVTILDLQRKWNRYEHKLVQLRGQFDQCGGATCKFCPEDMTKATLDENRCISLAFRTDGPIGGVPSENIPLMHRLYRFSTVTLEATFTAECFHDEMGRSIGDVICTGWPANLYAPRVLEVRSRKSARDGLVTAWGDIGGLIEPPAEERDAMLKEFGNVVFLDPSDMAVFAVQLSAETMENKRRGDPYVIDGLGCMCTEASCEGRWPTRAFEGMNSPANPFDCWFMQKQEGGWRVLPRQN